MALSHALVVDDSRAARVALKKLLEEQEITVSMAASGEEALEFLKRSKVDVVFMDHTMPGMDGLEAVTAIKANPDTATIPVMMYTTREGEVYVGQARALGAVGVLPKNVQPHQLFEMLEELGLVKDRRKRTSSEVPASLDQQVEQEALGISVKNLVGRILEDQHMTLRSDILRSQRTFAKEVAKEIVLEQARAEEALEIEPAAGRSSGGWFGNALSALLIFVVALLSVLAWQFKTERDEAYQRIATQDVRTSVETADEVESLKAAVALSDEAFVDVRSGAIDALAWAVNGRNGGAMTVPAYDAALADRVNDLLGHLRVLGFTGEVRLTSHLGQFCLTIDELGNYTVAPDDLPAIECGYLGHVLETSTRVSDRLSVPFSRLFREYDDGPIRLELVALDLSESSVAEDYPDIGVSAGVWNRIARANNRVEIDILPDD